MGFSKGEILLDSPTGAYYSGQLVNGRLVFELQKVKKFRGIHFNVKGFCKVHWTTSRSRRTNNGMERYTVNHDSYEEYITLQMFLVGNKWGGEHSLNPGKYEYPFQFQLPATCPSSFEGTVGHVRYELRATMDIPYAPDKEIIMDLRVLAPLDLNALNCKDPVTFEIEQSYCCWCCASGGSVTVAKMPVRGYCPGQVIPVELSCKNNSSVEIDYISFKIKKEVKYRAVHEPDHKEEEQTVLEMKKGIIPAHTDRAWVVEMPVPDMDVHNMAGCSFIDVSYEFKIKVSPEGCHDDDDDSCEIFFGTIPIGAVPTIPHPGQPQINMQYPPAIAHYQHPIINQPVSAYQPNSPFPPNPYPNSSPYPSPNQSFPSNTPYPTPSYPNNAPYPNNPPIQTGSPYPPNNAPYPNNTPNQMGSPYPPNSAPYPNSSPHVSPYPNRSPYPTPRNPHEDKPGTIGFKAPDHGNSASVPLLPPGSVPYPIGGSKSDSPFAAASAPAPGTPENLLDKAFNSSDGTDSPYNPAFMDDKKEKEKPTDTMDDKIDKPTEKNN